MGSRWLLLILILSIHHQRAAGVVGSVTTETLCYPSRGCSSREFGAEPAPSNISSWENRYHSTGGGCSARKRLRWHYPRPAQPRTKLRLRWPPPLPLNRLAWLQRTMDHAKSSEIRDTERAFRRCESADSAMSISRPPMTGSVSGFKMGGSFLHSGFAVVRKRLSSSVKSAYRPTGTYT